MTARITPLLCRFAVALVACVTASSAAAVPAGPSDHAFQSELDVSHVAPSSGDGSSDVPPLSPSEPRGTDAGGSPIDRAIATSAEVTTALTAHGASILDMVGVTPLVAGYSRFEDPEPLAHETRETIYRTVRDEPGIYVARLARVTDTPVSTVRYHTRVLVDAGLLERLPDRSRNRLVPADIDTEAVVTVDGTRRDLLRTLREHGPATGSDIATRLDLSKSTVSYHLERLASEDLVERDQSGRTVTNDVTPTATAMLGAVAED
jgi:predicted transcriptional regulator